MIITTCKNVHKIVKKYIRNYYVGNTRRVIKNVFHRLPRNTFLIILLVLFINIFQYAIG